jgi:uncharacterized membrane protein YfcA
LADLLSYQYALIGLLFIWGGFVRSGLGFGGAVLTLPFLLLILNEPLFFLPIIAIHLLFFSALTVLRNSRHSTLGRDGKPMPTIDWAFLRHAIPIMAVPKLIGVLGVITLPAAVTSGFIFAIVSVYSLSYILNRPFKSNSKLVDNSFLVLGGYISGTSLIAAPLVVPVAASRVDRLQLRDTLFVLWFLLVSVKVIAFLLAGVDMHWAQHLWLLPCAAMGHVLGLKFHAYTLSADTVVFFRVMGLGLLTVSLTGLWQLLLA